MTGPDCTSAQVDVVNAYLDELRVALNLRHWDVFLGEDEAEEGVHASVWPCEGRHVAAVRLHPTFWDLAADTKRSVLTHEVLHLIHRDLAEVTRSGLHAAGYLPKRAYRMHWEQVRLELELMVDHLTTVLAPTMPPWTDGHQS